MGIFLSGTLQVYPPNSPAFPSVIQSLMPISNSFFLTSNNSGTNNNKSTCGYVGGPCVYYVYRHRDIAWNFIVWRQRLMMGMKRKRMGL